MIAMTDEQLLRIVRANPSAVDVAQRRATASWNTARCQREAQVARIDTEWNAARARAGAIEHQDASTPAAREARGVAALRHAIETEAHFVAHAATPWAHLAQQARLAAHAAQVEAVATAQRLRDEAAAAELKGAGLANLSDPRDVIAALAARGVALGVDHSGRIEARPADAVGGAERVLIVKHRAALLGVLTGASATF